jgi:hypothetical protein
MRRKHRIKYTVHIPHSSKPYPIGWFKTTNEKGRVTGYGSAKTVYTLKQTLKLYRKLGPGTVVYKYNCLRKGTEWILK